MTVEIHRPERPGSDSTKKLIRLIAPRFPALNIFSRLSIPPLGLLYVGTAAERTGKYEVEIIDENNCTYSDHCALQTERRADVVGFYCGLSSTMPRVFELAKLYREMGVLTVSGGGHVDALPEESLDAGIDIVFLGEAEESFIEVLDAYFKGLDYSHIDGIACTGPDGERRINKRRSKPVDLGAVPDPDFSLIRDMRRESSFSRCRVRGAVISIASFAP